MDDDDEWDTDPDHVAPPDSKGTGAGQRAIDNPFDQNRRHSQEIAAQKQQTATVAAREAPKVVKKAPGGTIGGGGGEPCTACGKTVYAAEKIAASKGVWHKDCFTCGSCFKKLDLHSYRIDRASGKPYCVAHLPAEDRALLFSGTAKKVTTLSGVTFVRPCRTGAFAAWTPPLS